MGAGEHRRWDQVRAEGGSIGCRTQAIPSHNQSVSGARWWSRGLAWRRGRPAGFEGRPRTCRRSRVQEVNQESPGLDLTDVPTPEERETVVIFLLTLDHNLGSCQCQGRFQEISGDLSGGSPQKGSLTPRTHWPSCPPPPPQH